MMAEIYFKELSYTIVGILFDVSNKLGPGYQEKYYQKAIVAELRKQGVSFKEQVPVPLRYEGEAIGRYFIDFVLDEKIVLEIKASRYFYKQDVKQILGYLKVTGIPLGILATFTGRGVLFRRILRGVVHK